jgi:uncharacterized membrane protein
VSHRAARIAIAVLSLVGVAVTSYLLYTRYSHTRIACPTGGCETVQESRYSELAGLPVAAVGLAGYLALLASTFVRAEWARAAAVALSLVAVVFAAYLLVLQLVVIDAVCAWCVASDCVIALIALIAVVDARRTANVTADATEARRHTRATAAARNA